MTIVAAYINQPLHSHNLRFATIVKFIFSANRKQTNLHGDNDIAGKPHLRIYDYANTTFSCNLPNIVFNRLQQFVGAHDNLGSMRWR